MPLKVNRDSSRVMPATEVPAKMAFRQLAPEHHPTTEEDCRENHFVRPIGERTSLTSETTSEGAQDLSTLHSG